MQITLTNQIRDIERIHRALNEYLWTIRIEDYERKKISITVDEVLSNIIKYGYDDDLEHTITFHIIPLHGSIELEFIDDGKHFDPLDYLRHQSNVLSEDKTGGFGLKLISKLMHDIHYNRNGHQNILRIKLNYKPQA